MTRHAAALANESASGYVARLTRRARSSFYYAFLTLPRARRDGIIAVYAFCRAADNAVDDASDAGTAHRELARWREQLTLAYEGQPTDPVALRVAEVAREFDLPRAFFDEVLDGVARDIEPQRFRTWEDLAGYCDLVAGAVGRLSVRVFGIRDPEADYYARDLGAALQLTNILRDLGPDAALGRFYLPQEDLQRFGVGESDVLNPDDPRRRALLAFQTNRARAFFAAARARAHRWPREIVAAEAMSTIYQELLRRLEAASFPTTGPPVRVSSVAKVWLALRTWMRWRWVAHPD